MKKKYALFIGRWQNWHKGHEWLIRQQYDQGKNVWLAIRDVEVDENNPKSAQQIYTELINDLFVMIGSGRLMISVIPDIESVNYGRGVGYDVIYHEPPTEVGEISGTKIRKGQINPDGTSKEAHS
jgi:phosphopantetheine adenylyltransferase